MNKAVAIQTIPIGRPSELAIDNGGTIRRQILGAALFPLAFFGLLSILVTASALYEMTARLAADRNAAESRAYAFGLALADARNAGTNSGVVPQQPASYPASEQVVLLSDTGQVLSTTGPALIDASFVRQELPGLVAQNAANSLLTTSPLSQDQIILSYAPIPGTGQAILMAEPWSVVMTPVFYYQLVLVGLLVSGTLLSLLMLSVIVGRITRPITVLAGTAARAVPGSVFHPVPERGPFELRSLTASFNQMVIQLAEQQTTLRQYAQKALLSQEQERQRLSHELHDGTVQDLVGLAQRLELCRAEMDRDPAQAKRRLDELSGLARDTLNEVRQISNALRPSVLQDLGLAAALRALCHDLEGEMPGVQCVCTLKDVETGKSAQPPRLPAEMELAVFRVAQEALTNVRKHAARVTLVELHLELSDRAVQLVVSDNGRGSSQPDLNKLVRAGHLGFAGMYERARLFGGTLDVNSAPASGTTITMSMPR